MDMDVDQAMDSAQVDSTSRIPNREQTELTRRKPGDAAHLVATFDRGQALDVEKQTGPVELAIQATNADGELAPWLDDLWWTDAITRWTNEAVTLRIAPTPDALLHPVLLYQLHMLRRVVPGWRIVGHAYVDDVQTEDQIKQVALSPYHEVRFIDQSRPKPASTYREPRLALQEVIGLIRVEQRRAGLNLPVLSRLPAANG